MTEPSELNLGNLTECAITTAQEADLITGFVYGFTGNNYQTYYQTCYQDTPEFQATCCEAYTDVISGNNAVLIQGVNIFLGEVPTLDGFL